MLHMYNICMYIYVFICNIYSPPRKSYKFVIIAPVLQIKNVLETQKLEEIIWSVIVQLVKPGFEAQTAWCEEPCSFN